MNWLYHLLLGAVLCIFSVHVIDGRLICQSPIQTTQVECSCSNITNVRIVIDEPELNSLDIFNGDKYIGVYSAKNCCINVVDTNCTRDHNKSEIFDGSVSCTKSSLTLDVYYIKADMNITFNGTGGSTNWTASANITVKDCGGFCTSSGCINSGAYNTSSNFSCVQNSSLFVNGIRKTAASLTCDVCDSWSGNAECWFAFLDIESSHIESSKTNLGCLLKGNSSKYQTNTKFYLDNKIISNNPVMNATNNNQQLWCSINVSNETLISNSSKLTVYYGPKFIGGNTTCEWNDVLNGRCFADFISNPVTKSYTITQNGNKISCDNCSVVEIFVDDAYFQRFILSTEATNNQATYTLEVYSTLLEQFPKPLEVTFTITNDSFGGKNQTGVIIGVVIVAVLAVVIILIAVFVVKKRKQTKQKGSSNEREIRNNPLYGNPSIPDDIPDAYATVDGSNKGQTSEKVEQVNPVHDGIQTLDNDSVDESNAAGTRRETNVKVDLRKKIKDDTDAETRSETYAQVDLRIKVKVKEERINPLYGSSLPTPAPELYAKVDKSKKTQSKPEEKRSPLHGAEENAEIPLHAIVPHDLSPKDYKMCQINSTNGDVYAQVFKAKPNSEPKVVHDRKKNLQRRNQI